MANQVGIDVGGTFTDAVLIAQNRIISHCKVPTQADNLLDTLLNALESLNAFQEQVEKITVSTTLITNAILQNKLQPVELVVFPGSGMRLDALTWPQAYHVLTGEIDYRGRTVTAPDPQEWDRVARQIASKKVDRVAVVSKFSHRNKALEQSFADYMLKRYPQAQVALGHEWGQANFYRRCQTTWLNLGGSQIFSDFAAHLKQAVEEKGSKASIYVLKADGGIGLLDKTRSVESIYSGPAASVLGAIAQSEPNQSYVVVDIGGTTTDLGLVLSGKPLLRTKGANIGPYATQVNSLAVQSVPIGGDSAILPAEPHKKSSEFVIAPYRTGAAYCCGGKNPTPTDAMRFLNLTHYGSRDLAAEGLAMLLPEDKHSEEELKALALQILERMSKAITSAIDLLHAEWQQEPAYKIWEVLNPQGRRDFHIWISGGSAMGISSFLEKELRTHVRVGHYSGVSNAIGAAMARPTFSCTLHIDTTLKKYSIEETGEQRDWTGSSRPHKEVNDFIYDLAQRMASENGIELIDPQIRPFDFFPVIQGYRTVGQIVRGALIVPPGVMGRLSE